MRVGDHGYGFRPRPSRYGNRCRSCGDWFEAGHGWLIGRDEEAGSWILECCECFGRDTPEAAAWAPPRPEPPKLPPFAAALGLDRWPASRSEVKAAYRRLAMVHHPDKGGDAGRFVRLTEAYERALSHAEAAR